MHGQRLAPRQLVGFAMKRAALGALSPRKYPLITAAADTLICPSSTDRYYTLGIDLVVAGICGVLNKE